MDDAEHILDEATDWLLALTERPGDRSTRARFQQWLAADRRHGEVWENLNDSYDLIGKTQPQMTTHWPEVGARARSRRWFWKRERGRRETGYPLQTIRKRRVLAVAASVALAVWLVPEAMLALQADHRTGTGELHVAKLEDGSIAQLGPGSAIRVSYAEGERRIDLLAGEALFQVTPDKSRPFRVHADDVTITVLGTGFDVRRLQFRTEVGVQHGRVRVDRTAQGASPVFLSTGDLVAIGEDGTAVTGHMAPQLIASWALHEVNARDRAVSDVIDDIRPWYRGKIVVMSKALGKRRVNGVYDPRDPSKAIRSMILPLGGAVTQITPWLIVIHE
ncbi:transmembrane sensor [Sphingobium xenophagum]|uniref:Transmembrane sensor n=1 Tax=Sphingobium xenophagum TaxID=121428 RepID=A0ABU1X0H5_SPHXE|nr:FecR domain-containing protein [Sphingobium xenophagum]MDR7154794.1 transmembrane sensor [Sphingobium xenophagum]